MPGRVPGFYTPKDMRRRVFIAFLLSVTLLAATGCRSRKTPPPVPQPVPEVARTPAPPPPAEPVPSPERELEAPADPDVLSDDLAEATRQAHDRGWLRDAFFSFDASTLDADAQAALQQSATWLRAHPEYQLLIAGHCDERGTEQYN